MIRFRYALPTLLILFCAFTAFAQNTSFTLLDLDVDDYPLLRARFFLSDTDGVPIRDLLPGDIDIRDNSVEHFPLSLSCPSPAAPERISSVLAVDISGSMLNSSNIEIARAAANAWIDAVPLGYSECAMTSFDHEGYLNRDFTMDRQALRDAVGTLKPDNGGTDYNAGLISDPVGAVRVATAGKHRRVVVFLTDGEGGGDEEAIVQAALDNGVTVYAVVLRMRAPQLLKNVAERTGGQWFEGVESREEAMAIYRSILRLVQGEEPCTLEWEAHPDCAPHHELEIAIPLYDVSWKGDYILPNAVLPALSFSPSGVSFGLIPPGSSKDTVVTITARNRAVTVFNVEGESPFFAVVSGAEDLPFILDPGESRDLTIRFSPTDSIFRYGRIVLESDACSGRSIGCTGGLPGIRASEATLRLIAPNGGEFFPVGGDVMIEWEGILPEDTVALEYSIDGGLKWARITDSATGLRYLWTAPPTPSDRCLMRVRQLTAAGLTGSVVIPGPERLSAGDFSPDDRLVAIGETDVSVHDSYTGELLSQVASGVQPAHSLQFSSDGANLLVGSGGVLTYLYDWQTSQVVRSYGGPDVQSASRLSPDGSRVASHSYESDVVIYDATTAQELRRLNGHILRGFAVAWSPDGKRIVSGGTDNQAIIWDAETGTELHRLPHRNWVNSAFFSPDGGRVVTASSDSMIRIWDAMTGALIREIPEPVAASSAQFSPDGERICITRFDPVVEIRDAATGDPIRELIGHRRSVLFADWSGDGTRLLTVSWDSTARIWDLARVPNQSDISDGLWSIVEPKLALLDVNMERVAVGSSRDSVVSGWLCNDGTVRLTIDSITFANGRDFSLVSGFPPFMLAPGDCAPVEFRFVPGRVGYLSDSIIVHAGSFSQVATIQGYGILDPLRLVTESIDFGQVMLGDRKDTLVTVVLRNVGAVPLGIARTELAGPDRDQFFILSGGGAFALDPGETRAMELRFAPTRKGRTSGSILIEYSTITNSILGLPPAVVLLNGEGICPEDAPDHTLFIPETLEAAPGERVDVPLLIDASDDSLFSGKRRYTLLLRFNKSLLAPLDSASLDVMTDDERVLMYEGEWSGEGEGLRVLSFIAALGNAESTPIVIESFVWEDGCDGGLAFADGKFRLRELCTDGGTRLFSAGDSIFLKPVIPNPVRGHAQIEYGVIEEGETELLLLDANGRKVATLVSASLPSGHYLLDVSTAVFPSGAYYLLLRTPTQVLARSLLIEQ